MKQGMFARLALIMGVVLGLTALWASAAPVLGGANSVFGGYERRFYYTSSHESQAVGCTVEYGCQYCAYTVWMDCTDFRDWNGDHPCTTGGSIVVAVPDFEYEYTRASSPAACDGGPTCITLYHAFCSL
jgi:hypothetical protein